MKKFLVILFLAGSWFSGAAAAPAVKAELSSKNITQGSVFLIKVFDKNAERVKIKESVFPLFAGKDGVSKGVLIGVPAWWDIGGKYALEIDGKTTGQIIEIAGRESKTEKIDIEKSKLVTNEETAKEDKILRQAIAELKSKKYWSGSFVKPVEGRITTEFGIKRTVNGSQGGVHRGVDIAAKEGTDIKAANDGVVTLARKHTLTGNTVVINHGAGVVSVYYHMSEILVKEGSNIKTGEVLGRVGSTGVSTGAHLHWGIWIFGVDVNPLELIEKEIDF